MPPGAATGTRRRLLEAAALLIPEVGWGNVSTRRVAQAAGVNAGVVHYHFASVAELLRSAAELGIRRSFEGPVERMLGQGDAASGVRALLGELADAGTDRTTHILLFESTLAATRDPLLRAQIAAMLTEVRERLTEWLREVADVPEPASAAALIAAVIDGYLLHRAVDPTLPPDLLAPALDALLARRRP